MKIGLWHRLIACILCIFFVAVLPLGAADPTVTIEPYTKDEFPGWLQDLRRAEIVSLGSLPFVTLGVTLGYSLYRYFSNDMNPDYFPNPFAKASTARLTTEEQLGILFTSLGIGALVGITDFTISSIQRHQRKKAEEKHNREAVEIIPLQSTETVEPLPLEEVDTSNEEDLSQGEGTTDINEIEGVIIEKTQDIPLVEKEYQEFSPFGLFVTMPEFNGVYPRV